MLVIREVFITRPGMASKLAKLMHDNFREEGTRVMTDLTGKFNQVVMETEVKDLAEFERRMKEYGSDPKIKEKMKGYTDMYQTGRREIYQLL